MYTVLDNLVYRYLLVIGRKPLVVEHRLGYVVAKISKFTADMLRSMGVPIGEDVDPIVQRQAFLRSARRLLELVEEYELVKQEYRNIFVRRVMEFVKRYREYIESLNESMAKLVANFMRYQSFLVAKGIVLGLAVASRMDAPPFVKKFVERMMKLEEMYENRLAMIERELRRYGSLTVTRATAIAFLRKVVRSVPV